MFCCRYKSEADKLQPEEDAIATQLLERAFAEAAKLPERDQEALATLLMEEMEAEKKWDEAFASSQDLLAQMAEEALAEYRRGETRPLDVNAL